MNTIKRFLYFPLQGGSALDHQKNSQRLFYQFFFTVYPHENVHFDISQVTGNEKKNKMKLNMKMTRGRTVATVIEERKRAE